MRIEQPEGKRGSLKWIQRAVNEQWPSMNQPIAEATGSSADVDWLSPIAADNFAEYRDGAFLDLIGQAHLAPCLKDYWPVRGPQWDALGRTSRGDVLLVEAKAHIAEMCTPGTAAGAQSRSRIEASLAELAQRLGADRKRAPWADHFYQLANRLAHLSFLRLHGVPAWLVLVNFVGDREMGGPVSSEVWEAAYQIAFCVMGLPRKHPLSPIVVYIFPTVPGPSPA